MTLVLHQVLAPSRTQHITYVKRHTSPP